MKIPAPDVPLISEVLLRNPAHFARTNPRVSERSFYLDEVWRLTPLHPDRDWTTHQGATINWAIGLHRVDPQHRAAASRLLDTCKQASVLLRHDLWSQAAGTVANRARRWVHLVNFMVCRREPIWHFQDLDEELLEEFLEQVKRRLGCKGDTLADRTIRSWIDSLVTLYQLGDQLHDGMDVDPDFLFGLTLGRNDSSHESGTEPIPDDDFRRIVSFAEQQIRENAGRIFDRVMEWQSLPSAVRFGERSSEGVACGKAMELLRSACFVLIAASTGMRIEEIRAMRHGCLREEFDAGSGKTLLWIDSKLWKLQAREIGEDCSWLCGPLAPTAIRCLEDMGNITVEDLGARKIPLFLRSNVNLAIRKPMSLGQTRIRETLKDFYAQCGTSCYTPHQFRRTFARCVVRWARVPILALRDHFQHVSVCMTERYAHDEELLEFRLTEIESAGVEQAIPSKVVDCPIKTGPGYKRREIKLWREEGVPILRCATSTRGITFCGSPDGAHVPPGTRNSERQGPLPGLTDFEGFHRELLRRAEAGYAAMSAEARRGPAGELSRGRIRLLQTVLNIPIQAELPLE